MRVRGGGTLGYMSDYANRRPWTAGQVIGRTFSVLSDRFKPLTIVSLLACAGELLLAAAVAGTGLMVGVGVFLTSAAGGSEALMTVGTVFMFLIAGVGTIWLVLAQMWAHINIAESHFTKTVKRPWTEFTTGFKKAWPFGIVLTIVALVGAFGTLWLVAPGVWWFVSMFPVAAIMALERGSVFDSFERAWKLVSGHRWHILGSTLLAFLAMLPAVAVFVLLLLPEGAVWLLVMIPAYFLRAVLAMFGATFTTVMYVNLVSAQQSSPDSGTHTTVAAQQSPEPVNQRNRPFPTSAQT